MEVVNSKLDSKGFLQNSEDWDQAIAQQIARQEGMDELDVKRLEIIDMLREYYRQYGMIPMLRKACRTANENCLPCLAISFDGDPIKAVKIAGLPQPVGEVFLHYRHTCCNRTNES